MRINKILEIYNTILKERRNALELNSSGFFVSLTNVQHSIGSIMKGSITIKYRLNDGTLIDFSTTEYAAKIPSSEREAFIERLEEIALHDFIAKDPLSEDVIDDIII